MNTSISGAGGATLLPHLGLLRFSGADAAAFLQGQVSNDTRRLTGGAPLLAAYSTPQGRVISLLHLLPHSTGIIAVVARDLVQTTHERLRKYIMRSKVLIEDVTEQFTLMGLHNEATLIASGLPLPGAAPGYAERGGIGVARIGGTHRWWAVGEVAPMRAFNVAPATATDHATWRLADIHDGLPQIYAATSEMFVAQMLNLDLLDGISFTKGCFTGQEIVARTQHLGRIKRRLHRLRLPAAPWSIGQAVQLADGRSGRLTELASTGDAVEALAVLTLPATDASAAPDGEPGTHPVVDAVELPLPYSLDVV